MTEEFATDVLICGAGAAGLTLAIDLARRGVSFRLIEIMDDPFRGSRGKGIQPRSQEIFEDLGILDRVVAVGGVYPAQREYREGDGFEESLVMEHQDPTTDEPYHIPLLVPQFLTEGVMRERLAELGHKPQFSCELTSFTQDCRGVVCRLANASGEETLRVRYLVGTDGGRSFVRHALDVGFPGNTLGVRAVVADVILDGLGRDAWHRFNEGSMARQMSLCPLAGTDLFQLQAPVPLEGEVDLTAEGLTRMVAERTRRGDIAIRSVSWASAFDMNARLADRYRIDRVFLAGDAAHIHPPTGGQGLNTSVQDAYNLGWKLAAVLAGAPDALLDTLRGGTATNRRPDARPCNQPARSREARRGCDEVVRYINSISAIRNHRWQWRSRSATVAFSRATGRPMLGSAAPQASLRGCSSCSRGRTGPCSATTCKGQPFPLAPTCTFMTLRPTESSWMKPAICEMPMGLRPETGFSCGRMVTSARLYQAIK